MPTGLPGLLLALMSFLVTFVVARALSRRWRADRERKALDKTRRGESRQVRRQRERKGR
jgi:hypothetical protein